MKATTDLLNIPGVGKSITQDFIDLGIHSVNDLQGKDPEKLYQDLIELRGQHQDMCILYVFRSAIYYASTIDHESELLKWWNWKDKQSS